MELEAFVAEGFASLPRKDQRAKGMLYLRGLMLDGRRMSIQPMVGRLGVIISSSSSLLLPRRGRRSR